MCAALGGPHSERINLMAARIKHLRIRRRRSHIADRSERAVLVHGNCRHDPGFTGERKRSEFR
jgi:hypothetical protein